MADAPLTILYDGDCPSCRSYVSQLRLRAVVGAVDLVDARTDEKRVTEALAAGLDLDGGMVVLWQGERYFGADAVHLLAVLSAGGGVVNRLQRGLFRSPRVARRLYPWLVFGRRLWLRLIGRGRVGRHRAEGESPEHRM